MYSMYVCVVCVYVCACVCASLVPRLPQIGLGTRLVCVHAQVVRASVTLWDGLKGGVLVYAQQHRTDV